MRSSSSVCVSGLRSVCPVFQIRSMSADNEILIRVAPAVYDLQSTGCEPGLILSRTKYNIRFVFSNIHYTTFALR